MLSRLSKIVAVGCLIMVVVPFSTASQVTAGGGYRDVFSDARRTSLESSIRLAGGEPSAIAANPARASRTGHTLTVTSLSGKKLIFADSPVCEAPDGEAACIRYAFVGHSDGAQISLIAKISYESVAYISADDASGQTSVFHAFPYFSPSGHYALELSSADDDGSAPVELWVKFGPQYVVLKRFDFGRSGLYSDFTLVSWPNDLMINLSSTTDLGPQKTSVTRYVSITRRKTTAWIVKPAQ